MPWTGRTIEMEQTMKAMDSSSVSFQMGSKTKQEYSMTLVSGAIGQGKSRFAFEAFKVRETQGDRLS